MIKAKSIKEFKVGQELLYIRSYGRNASEDVAVVTKIGRIYLEFTIGGSRTRRAYVTGGQLTEKSDGHGWGRLWLNKAAKEHDDKEKMTEQEFGKLIAKLDQLQARKELTLTLIADFSTWVDERTKM